MQTRLSIKLNYGQQVRQGAKLNEKLVVRFYKEDLDGIEGQTQVSKLFPSAL
jgi:hypothetical protein